MAKKDTIVNHAPPHQYFHIILNMADDDLDPYEYRLLGHYVRVTSGGKNPCKEGIRDTATFTKMSVGTVRKARYGLRDKGYISLQEPTKEEAKNGQSASVDLLDLWAANIQRYSKGGVSNLTQGSEGEGVSNPTQGGVSNPTHLKELNTEETKKKKDSAAPNGAGDQPNTAKKKTSKPREPDLMFDAVASHIFKSDPATIAGDGGRIAPISCWLKGTSDGMKRGNSREIVGFISSPAQPEHVKMFAEAWQRENPKASIPKDFIKFVEAWRAWATQRAKAAAAAQRRQQNQSPAGNTHRKRTAEEQRQIEEEVRKHRPVWEKPGATQ